MKPRDTGATRALTVAEAADYLSVDLATIYRLPKRKELPAFNLNPA
jgi:excisionase family DNA binding protein